jgi:O-succinylbenzoic acid--CoA ligase
MHSDFRLNGVSYDRDHLLSHAHVLSNAKKEYLIELGRFILEWFSEEDDVVLQTSGSTGKPTQILALKTMLSASAMTTVKAFNLQPKQQALMCLPVRHIAGKMMLIRALLAGLWIDVIEPTTMPKVSKTYDFTAMTPHQLRNSFDHIDQFKQIIIGGAPVDDSLKAAVKGHTSRIFSTFGMTETYSHVALQNLSKGERQYTAVGDVTFSMEGDTLVVHAPHIGIEKLVTTDCVDLISSSEFVWKGRSDYVINSGGIKLHPEQIEKALSAFISVPFFVFGKPDKQLGQSLSIVFEGQMPNQIVKIISKLDTLSRYEKPKDYFVLSHFVRNNGKILRNQTLNKIDFV